MTLNKRTETLIRQHFDDLPATILWPSDLTKILGNIQRQSHAPDVTIAAMTDFVLKAGILLRAEFTSRKYGGIIRYLKGSHSPYQLAMCLRRDSFLCHATALVTHALQPPSQIVYVNKEQLEKGPPGGITQAGIRFAFKNQQRKSKYVFEYAGTKYVLVNGKNTNVAGVLDIKTPTGETVRVTNLERTLIDVVVRPAYAGGIRNVAAAYQKAVEEIDIDVLIGLLRRLDYAYPYHQSIGFLLERAGRSAEDCNKLARMGMKFKFFLDYSMKNPAFDEKWRVYFPSSLRPLRKIQPPSPDSN